MDETRTQLDEKAPKNEERGAAERQAEGINPADGPGPYGNPEIDRDKLAKVEDEIERAGPK